MAIIINKKYSIFIVNLKIFVRLCEDFFKIQILENPYY